MDPPRLGLARPRPPATGAASAHFVPPPLLRGGPEFVDSTVLAAKGSILIIAPPNEIGDAVAGRGPQPGGRDFNGSDGTIRRPGVDCTDPLSHGAQSLRFNLLAALFVAPHRESPKASRRERDRIAFH